MPRIIFYLLFAYLVFKGSRCYVEDLDTELGHCHINSDGSHDCLDEDEDEIFQKITTTTFSDLFINDEDAEEEIDYCEKEEEDPNSTDEGSRSMSFDDMSTFMPKGYGQDPDVVFKTQFLPMMEEMKKRFKASKYRLTFYQIIRPRLLKKCPNILNDPKSIKDEYHNCWINYIRRPGFELGWYVQDHLNAKDCVFLTNEGEYFDLLHEKGYAILRVHTTEFDNNNKDAKEMAIDRGALVRTIGYYRGKIFDDSLSGMISMNKKPNRIGLYNLLQKPNSKQSKWNYDNEIWKISEDARTYPIFNFGPEKEDYPQKQLRRIPVNFDEEKVTFVFPM